MGITANYAIVSKSELNVLMSGGGVQLVQDIYDDRYSFGPRFQPGDDSFQKEVEANPLALLDYAKLSATVEGMFAALKADQELSSKRLRSLDNEERLDEICKLYSRGQRRWERCDVPHEFGGLSEDELVAECHKRGYRLWIDLDKRWDTMHELLTGVTLRDMRDELALTAAMPFLERAETKVDFPKGIVSNLLEARVSLRLAARAVDRNWHFLEEKVHAYYQETDDCPDQVRDSLSAVEKMRSELAMAQPALYRCLMNIAAIAKENDRSTIETHRADIESARNLIESIHSSTSELSSKGTANELKEADLELSKNIFARALELKGLLTTRVRERPWLVHFGNNEPAPPVTDVDYLSLAVSGGKDVPGLPLNSHQPSYLTVEEVKKIALTLEPLESKDLSDRYQLPDLADWEEFYQFKKFYIRAAQSDCGVIAYYG